MRSRKKQVAIGEPLLFQVSNLFPICTATYQPNHQPATSYDAPRLEAEEAIHWLAYEAEHAEILKRGVSSDNQTNLSAVSANCPGGAIAEPTLRFLSVQLIHMLIWRKTPMPMTPRFIALALAINTITASRVSCLE